MDKMKTPKVCVVKDSGSCLRRSLDEVNIIKKLMNNKVEIFHINDIKEADMAIIITCGFNYTAQEIGREKIDFVRKYIDEKNILVIGCLPGTNKSFFTNTKIKFLTPSNYNKLDVILKEMGIINHLEYDEYFYNYGEFELAQDDAEVGKNNYYINVAQGCLGNCSYCAIKNSIGSLRSRPLKSLIIEAETAISKGAQGLYLGADDLGAWGVDIGKRFPELLEAMLNLKNENIHIDLRNVINPRWLVEYSDELVNIFSRYASKLPTISLAMQSGSHRILREQRRFEKTEKVLDIIDNLYQVNPCLYGFGHMIIGLPGEEEDDILKTIQFIKDSPIQFWTCFKYTRTNKNTPEYDEYSVNRNWDIFIEIIQKSGLLLKMGNGKSYVASKLDSRYIKMDFDKNM